MAGWSGDRISLGARDLSFLQDAHTSSRAHSVSHTKGTVVLSRGSKPAGGHSLPSVAEVKNEWSYTFMALTVKLLTFV